MRIANAHTNKPGVHLVVMKFRQKSYRFIIIKSASFVIYTVVQEWKSKNLSSGTFLVLLWYHNEKTITLTYGWIYLFKRVIFWSKKSCIFGSYWRNQYCPLEEIHPLLSECITEVNYLILKYHIYWIFNLSQLYTEWKILYFKFFCA